MDVQTLIAHIHQSRAAWQAVVNQLTEAQWAEPRLDGGWSVQDVLAHITWFDQEMVQLLQTRTLAGSDWWLLPAAERNARIYAQNRQRPLTDIRAEAEQVWAQLQQLLPTLSEADLHENGRIAQMPPDWTLLDLLPQNTSEHYTEHTRQVKTAFAIG
jgi:uncharacterized damage-inducible protein DinB